MPKTMAGIWGIQKKNPNRCQMYSYQPKAMQRNAMCKGAGEFHISWSSAMLKLRNSDLIYSSEMGSSCVIEAVCKLQGSSASRTVSSKYASMCHLFRSPVDFCHILCCPMTVLGWWSCITYSRPHNWRTATVSNSDPLESRTNFFFFSILKKKKYVYRCSAPHVWNRQLWGTMWVLGIELMFSVRALALSISLSSPRTSVTRSQWGSGILCPFVSLCCFLLVLFLICVLCS